MINEPYLKISGIYIIKIFRISNDIIYLLPHLVLLYGIICYSLKHFDSVIKNWIITFDIIIQKGVGAFMGRTLKINTFYETISGLFVWEQQPT